MRQPPCYNRAAVSNAAKSTEAVQSPVARLDSVPMLDLRRQFEQIRAEVLAAVGRVCESQHYILGPEVEVFEREVAAFCGVNEAIVRFCAKGSLPNCGRYCRCIFTGSARTWICGARLRRSLG